jgi:hypothetical protein
VSRAGSAGLLFLGMVAASFGAMWLLSSLL